MLRYREPAGVYVDGGCIDIHAVFAPGLPWHLGPSATD
jgi:hypothetical protein